MLLVGYLLASDLRDDWSKRLISIWRIDGLARWVWSAVRQIAPRSPGTAMAVL
ncbi:MAG: hypothetical protein Q4P24_17430 [Rhodobacterales bacterium]|nr:hypothetical protein [Rhodobacterales bacterium]